MGQATLVGQGNCEFTFDLPLPDPYWEQYQKGHLTPKTVKDREAVDRAHSAGPAAVEGSIADILTWVDDDPGKARAALEVEQVRDKPRKTLVAALTDIAGGE